MTGVGMSILGVDAGENERGAVPDGKDSRPHVPGRR